MNLIYLFSISLLTELTSILFETPPRIELWAYARRNPFVPWLGGDPLSFPFLKSNLVPWYWASLDFLEKRYQRNNPWKKVGKKCATDPAVLTSK